MYVRLDLRETGTLADFDQPCNLSSCPHITPQPGKKGRIFWLSGPPGAGKSTICQLLGRKEGFVYYEADAMMTFSNPFVPTNVDSPSLAHVQQKSLKVSKYPVSHPLVVLDSVCFSLRIARTCLGRS